VHQVGDKTKVKAHFECWWGLECMDL